MAVIVNRSATVNLLIAIVTLGVVCAQMDGLELDVIKVSKVVVATYVIAYVNLFFRFALVCIECDAGYYGRNCEEKCNCKRGSCDRFNGTCYCPAGWTGDDCSQGMSY